MIDDVFVENALIRKTVFNSIALRNTVAKREAVTAMLIMRN